jgi:acyl-CoA dehydrogenase family member 9
MRPEAGKTRTGFLEDLYTSTAGTRRLPAPPSVDMKKVRDFLERFRGALSGFEPAAIEARHTIPPELLERMKGSGVFGLMVPTAYGGLGFSLTEYLLAIEELSGVDLSTALIPLAHTSIGIKGILLFGSEDQKRRYLPRAATGELIFAYALTEPETGSDAQHIRTRALLADDGVSYILDGTKTFITNANYAGAFTVFAQMDPQKPGSMGAFIVERNRNGVSVGADMPKMGLAASSTATVMLRGVTVPRENLIGEPGDGFKIAMTILNYGRLGLGAGSAGSMAKSLEDMQRRAASRKQFGVPIGQFDLIREKLANAKAHGLAAAGMTYLTAAMLEQQPLGSVAIESSHCKLYGTTRCWDTLYEAQQLAGGSGYLSTQPYEKRLRDFRVTTIFEGTTEIHSMYPALTALRAAGKAVGGRSPLGKLLLLRRLRRPRLREALQDKARGPSPGPGEAALPETGSSETALPETASPEAGTAFRAAFRCAEASERLFRKLMVSGVLRYGTRIVEHELYLRRMTELSLSAYWLAATIWLLRSRHPDGRFPPEDLLSLEWLTEEARAVQQKEGRLWHDGHEALLRRLTPQPGQPQ